MADSDTNWEKPDSKIKMKLDKTTIMCPFSWKGQKLYLCISRKDITNDEGHNCAYPVGVTSEKGETTPELTPNDLWFVMCMVLWNSGMAKTELMH